MAISFLRYIVNSHVIECITTSTFDLRYEVAAKAVEDSDTYYSSTPSVHDFPCGRWTC